MDSEIILNALSALLGSVGNSLMSSNGMNSFNNLFKSIKNYHIGHTGNLTQRGFPSSIGR